MVVLIIQLISGAAGGNMTAALLQNFSLGPIGNSMAGVVGGALGGQLLGILTSRGALAALSAAGFGLNLPSILSSVAAGGLGGGIVTAIVGLIRNQLAKKRLKI